MTSSHLLVGTPRITGPRWSHLPTLTIGLLGVQIFWSVEMGYASPYLLSLGLSKSSMAVVFVAGPLSGLLMQPLIGALADTSTSRWGRRRPFMALGTSIACAGMVMLGFTKQFAGLLGGGPKLTIILAVLSIYLIDFSINAVMAVDRALLVDTLPPAKQAEGNAWAARMLGVGAVVGFAVGTVDLTKVVPVSGKGENKTTQLQVLSVIVSVLLVLGHAIMIAFVGERVLVKQRHARRGSISDVRGGAGLKKGARWRENMLVVRFKELWSNMVTLPRIIQQICIIQFFTWIAWFPNLFYTSIYVGDIYKRHNPLLPSSSSTPHLTPTEREAEATRLGSRALFWSSVLALFLNITLPAFIKTPASKKAAAAGGPVSATSSSPFPSASANGHGLNGDSPTSPTNTTSSWFKIPERLKVNLATLWAVSNLVLAGCMLGTLFTDSVGGATFLVAMTGFPWAVTQWAPFSLLGEAILTTPDPTSSRNARSSILLSDARTPIDTHGESAESPRAERNLDRGEEDEHGGADQEMEMKALLHNKKADGNDDGYDGRDDLDGVDDAHRKKVGLESRNSLSEGEDDDGDLEGPSRYSASHSSGRPNPLGMGNTEARTSRVGLLRLDTDPGLEDSEWEHVGGRVDDDVEEMGGVGRGEGDGMEDGRSGGGLSAKAGIILGIHNVFIVIPQFLVTGLSAVVFAIFDPVKAPPSSITAPAPPPPPAPDTTGAVLIKNGTLAIVRRAAEAAASSASDGQSNSVVYIFRIGGVSALIAFIISWRLARELRHR